MKICILGKPGSGKSVVSERISEEFNVRVVNVGSILRSNRNKRVNGETIGDYIERGDLVPSHIVDEIIYQELKDDGDFVIDGFPRTMDELDFLIEKIGIDVALFIDVSMENILLRLKNRLVCDNCGKSYHKIFMPPENDEICDKCGMKLRKRKDEGKEVVEERMRIFEKFTLPVIKKLKDMRKLIKIDGNKGFEEVWKEVKKALDDYISSST